jgi:hypothetical protein
MEHFSKKKIVPPRDRHNDVATSGESKQLAQERGIADAKFRYSAGIGS